MTRFGPERLDDGRTCFHLWAPARTDVQLEIFGGPVIDMARGANGAFTAKAACGAGALYRFRLDDVTAPDPASRAQMDGDVHGWSVVVDPAAYAWRTPHWMGQPWEQTVLLEVHAGVYGGFAGVMGELEGWRALGITAVELMPVAEFGGARNWGYDGVLLYAPAAAYGAPDDLKRLVDRAHELGLMMFLDVVYNHFGPDGNYLNVYAPQVFDEAVQTPWGAAIDFDRPQVRDFFSQNAVYWIDEYRFDGLRLDAVHAIKDHDWLDELAGTVRAAAPGRHVHLVLENEHNGAERLRGPFDAQWNDDFHNVMHVLLTGETRAYYQDFASCPAEKLARCLAEGFIYQGEPSPNHNGAPRGELSGDLPATAFVSFLQNHDQVGNRAMGERLIELAPSPALRAATALMLLCPHIPLLFMGEEIGSRTPFLFFTDFQDDLAEAVRDGRRREFAKFTEFSDPEARLRIPDPNAAPTFEQSRPKPSADADIWRNFHRNLLSIRRTRLVPRLKGARSEGARTIGEKAVLAYWRLADGARLSLAVNLEDKAALMPQPMLGELIHHEGEVSDMHLGPYAFCAWLEESR